MSSSQPSSEWRQGLRILYSAETIAARVRELGSEIARDLAGSSPVAIGILKGSFLFMSDLVRAIDLPLTCDFIGISSYGDATETSGVVQITRDLSESIAGKDVLIVEDIIDTGLTMQYLLANLQTRHPRSIRICTLLYKPSNARVQIPIDYIGFTIANEFVLGYGLDYCGRFRNLPYIGVRDGVR